MKMSKKFSRRFEVIYDWASIISGAFLCFLNFFKIVPGFGSAAALVATVIIAYCGPMGLIMVVLGVADLLKDRFSIVGPEDDNYCEEDDYYDEEDDYYEEDDDTDFLKDLIFGPKEDDYYEENEADDYYEEDNDTKDF